MAVLNRQITQIPNTTTTTVLGAPTTPAVRGLLSLLIHNPAGNSSLTATIGFHDGTTNHAILAETIAAGATAKITDKLLLTSTDTLRVTLSSSPTTPVEVIASYNDGQ